MTLARQGTSAVEVDADAFDVAIVGGGILGCCALWECARRGVRAILIEGGAFGAGTSAASHRIVHGGFRYLQTLDLLRVRASAREQAWFVRTFAELVRPLPCAVRLDGRGIRRRSAFAAARAAYASATLGIERSHIRNDAERRISAVIPGGVDMPIGWWTDALVVSHARVISALVRTARARGCVAIERTHAVGLEVVNARVRGVIVRAADGSERRVSVPRVLVACGTSGWSLVRAHAGAWHEQCASTGGGARVGLVNVMVDAPPACDAGVAVYPDDGAGRAEAACFVVPRQGRVMIGTAEFDASAADVGAAARAATAELVRRVGRAWPSLGVEDAPTLAIDAGVVPGEFGRDGRVVAAERPVVCPLAERGGVGGVVVAAAEKYTTARATAVRGLGLLLGPLPIAHDSQLVPSAVPEAWLASAVGVRVFWDGRGTDRAGAALRSLLTEEGLSAVADLISFRTEWGERPDLAEENCGFVCDAIGMSCAEAEECGRLVHERAERRRAGTMWLRRDGVREREASASVQGGAA